MNSFKAWRTRLGVLGLFVALLVSAACGNASASSDANTTTSSPAGNSASVAPNGTADPGNPSGGSGIAPTATPAPFGYPTPTPGPVTPSAAAYFTASHALYTLNLGNGALIFKQTLPGHAFQPSMAPAIGNGLVYVSDYYGNLTARNAHTGALVWQSKVPAISFNSPLVTSSLVYATY